MKKVLFISIVTLFLVSCTSQGDDLLDKVSSSNPTEEQLFTNATYANQFLTGIYSQLLSITPSGTETANTPRWRGAYPIQLDVSTDNGISHTNGSWMYFNAGAWDATSDIFFKSDWLLYWGMIRSCLFFMSRIDGVPNDTELNFFEGTKTVQKAEAEFLMAFAYSELAKEFGGVPLMKQMAVNFDDSVKNLPRATYDETIDFIVSLCNHAALNLPVTQVGTDFGRVTSGAAMALKSHVLLYAASPLWNNPNKPNDSPFRGKYNTNKWMKAAKAADTLIGLGRYSLYPDISTMFTTRNNPEYIFMRMNEPSSWMTSSSVPNKLYTGSKVYGQAGYNQVTYNMIREYEVINNGKAYYVNDPLSGNDSVNNPYKNRDPRFYRDCLFNGAKIRSQTVSLGEFEEGATLKPMHNPQQISAFYSHVYSIKYADLTMNINFDARVPGNGARSNNNYPYIRYAEILLNFAEAMNEAYGPEVDGLGLGRTALWALNQVRTRSKTPTTIKAEYLGQTLAMPKVESGVTKEQMREKIRHERRVEFAFEEHRFWDLRRWKINPNSLVKIKIQVPIWTKTGTVHYEVRDIETRKFDSRIYRMPIPEGQLFSNRNLVQNPGWPLSPEASED